MKKALLLLFAGLMGITMHAQKQISNLNIENNDDFSSFAMLDSAIGDATVFFTGENHNFRTSNYKLQLKMLRYLNQKAGVRHLFLEFGVSRGWLVNSYVQTGDSTLFDILEDYSYEEYALLYKELMLYNKTLPDDKKITIHGIDIERSWSTPVKVLSMLLPAQKPPREIELNIESLKSLSGMVDEQHDKLHEEENEEGKLSYYNGYSYPYNYSRYNTENTLKIVVNDYDSLKSVYQTYLGDKAPLFDEIIEGIKAEFKRNEYSFAYSMQAYIYREQFMYNQLLQLVSEYPGEKFYGQFGRCHTPVTQQDKWCDFYFFNSLATRLNESEEPGLKDKVFSIGIYYPESTSFEIQVTAEDKLNDLFVKHGKEGLKLIEIDPSDTTLFKGVVSKYQYLIINYDAFKIEETSHTSEVDKDLYPYDNGFEYGYMFPNIEAHAGYLFMKLDNLNSTMEYHGLPILKSPQLIYGGAATLYEDWFMYGSVSYHILPKTTNRYSDTTSLSFSGSFIKGYLGFETTASEVFNFTPRLGFGYGSLRFKQEFDSAPAASGTGIFQVQPSNTIEYFNNAFLLDPSFDIRFNMRYVALGLNTGYQIDISERSWQASNTGFLSNSPRTSMSGFYALLTLSLFYSLW